MENHIEQADCESPLNAINYFLGKSLAGYCLKRGSGSRLRVRGSSSFPAFTNLLQIVCHMVRKVTISSARYFAALNDSGSQNNHAWHACRCRRPSYAGLTFYPGKLLNKRLRLTFIIKTGMCPSLLPPRFSLLGMLGFIFFCFGSLSFAYLDSGSPRDKTRLSHKTLALVIARMNELSDKKTLIWPMTRVVGMFHDGDCGGNC
jgi:hypothetical protein